MFKKWCFTGPENQRFRLKRGLFFSKILEKGCFSNLSTSVVYAFVGSGGRVMHMRFRVPVHTFHNNIRHTYLIIMVLKRYLPNRCYTTQCWFQNQIWCFKYSIDIKYIIFVDGELADKNAQNLAALGVFYQIAQTHSTEIKKIHWERTLY